MSKFITTFAGRLIYLKRDLSSPQNEELRRNGSRMDGERSGGIVRSLRGATADVGGYYGNDLKTAAQLLNRVLRYESRRAGFELTAARDAEFNEVGGDDYLECLGGGTRDTKTSLMDSPIRIWFELEVPYWTRTPKRTGSKSRRPTAALPTCSGILRTTQTLLRAT